MSLSFHFYPTLLNEYQRYTLSESQEAFDRLFKRINRIPEKDPEVLKRFASGISFEEAVLKGSASSFPEKLIAEAQMLLPKKRKTQQLVRFTESPISFYGYADVVGGAQVIDLKWTRKYEEGRFKDSFQNLYLYALKDFGFETMKYIVCDGNRIHQEEYRLGEYDFAPLLIKMKSFADFLLAHRQMIRDKKIIQERDWGLFENF
ncbi:hypothetical protein LAG90_06380 [Marinilongibacter aquaticus]|uniref:hypothetical protein n=1 Tax=Marinilongibacter aquaticus TaxID=2975157 RepID=UPI0021BDCF48|nr:hypothetical protein [Marinilongibacter aquaticus]UBM60268.1 hypothetical protein LAG90_06380 [Marinilongibacter aquaticus]